jgi:hypothetical protein
MSGVDACTRLLGVEGGRADITPRLHQTPSAGTDEIRIERMVRFWPMEGVGP